MGGMDPSLASSNLLSPEESMNNSHHTGKTNVSDE